MSEPQPDTPPETVPRSPDPAAATLRQARRSRWIIAIMALVLAAILVATWVWRGGSGSGAQQAATAFFRANADQGAAAAYNLTAPTFRDVTPEPSWAQISQNYQLGRLSDADWTQHDAEGNVTTVRGQIHREGLPDLPVAVDLRRIDGDWKVASIAFEKSAQPAAAAAASLQNEGANAPQDSLAAQPSAQPAAPLPAMPSDDTPGPVMSVPRFGPAPVQRTVSGGSSAAPGGGRSGPIGSAVASGQVGPTCMGQLARLGLRTTSVDCPIYLATRPGAVEQCVARTQAGASIGVSVTFVDYDPITKQSAIDCRPN